MEKPCKVKVVARWDDMASLWVATSTDVPGLATAASSIPDLKKKLAIAIPELLALNIPTVPQSAEIPYFLMMRGQSDVVVHT